MATAATSSPLTRLQAQGQSVWLDFISREVLDNGEVRRLIEEEGLQGMTSNPTIFEKAIGHTADYDEQMRELVANGTDPDQMYYELTNADIRRALDLFRPVYDRENGGDGFVSLEVSPLMAHNQEETIDEAKKLWNMLERPNAMIKIPGTPEGIPAVEESLASGLNINITLLFGVDAYEAVANAYMRALKRRAEAGQPIDRIASVASFFVSRIDTETDKRLDALLEKESDPKRRQKIESLKGKAAIANAKNAYAVFQKVFGSPEFQALKAKGAKVQRVLWASVGTKNKAYPDTLYIDELIGPETVSTMPPATYDAFKDHGRVDPQPSLLQQMDDGPRVMADLAEVGIDFKDVTDTLVREGVKSFADSFDDLLKAIREKRETLQAQASK